MTRTRVRTGRSAFTLVELLVVIAVIGTLVGLLLPAVQAARSSARRTATLNKLRQLGLGCHGFLDVHRFFPWPGLTAVRDSDPPGQATRGSLSGSWAFMILPFIEEKDVQQRWTHDPPAARATQNREFAVSAFLCAERGRKAFATEYVVPGVSSSGRSPKAPEAGAGTVGWAGCGPMTDFALNARLNFAYGSIPSLVATPDTGWGTQASSQPNMKVSTTKIPDGLSKTILLGQKYVAKWAYAFPNSTWDETAFQPNGGANRMGWYVIKDGAGATDMNWGSPFDACPFVMCDGAVRSIENGIHVQNLGLLFPADRIPTNSVTF